MTVRSLVKLIYDPIMMELQTPNYTHQLCVCILYIYIYLFIIRLSRSMTVHQYSALGPASTLLLRLLSLLGSNTGAPSTLVLLGGGSEINVLHARASFWIPVLPTSQLTTGEILNIPQSIFH